MGTTREELLGAIMRSDYQQAQGLRDQLASEKRRDELDEARRIAEKYFNVNEYLQSVDIETERGRLWGKIKNHEILTPIDQLKMRTIQTFETDMARLETLGNTAIESLENGGRV